MTEAEVTGWFTLAGTLVGAGITYLGAVCMANRAAKLNAIAKFKDAFSEELAFIIEELERGRPVKTLNEVLDRSLSKHLFAVREVKGILGSAARNAVDKAWQQHCYGNGKMRFHQYLVPEPTKESAQLCVANIEALLSCARI